MGSAIFSYHFVTSNIHPCIVLWSWGQKPPGLLQDLQQLEPNLNYEVLGEYRLSLKGTTDLTTPVIWLKVRRQSGHTVESNFGPKL